MKLKKTVYGKITIFSILLLGSVLIQSCSEEPTAKLVVSINVNGCLAQYETTLWTSDGVGAAVIDLATLDRVSAETPNISGCGIEELEYSFNISPVIAKIEFEIGEEEVTAFVPMQKGVTAPSPFIDGNIDLEKIIVSVDFPNGNPAQLIGYYTNN